LEPIFKTLAIAISSSPPVKGLVNIENELLRYGLLTKNYVAPTSNNRNGYQLIFSDKLERYKYWLEISGKMPDQLEICKIEPKY